METRTRHLKPLLLAASVLLTAGGMVHAQNGGQPIIFSSPDSATETTTPSMTGKTGGKLQDTLQVPQSPFATPNDTLSPMPAPSVSRPALSETDRLKKMLGGRKDWVFMTPAEMLGVDDSKNALNVPDRDAAGNRKMLTPEERYTERRNQSRLGSTNGLTTASSGWNLVYPDNQPNGLSPTLSGNPNLVSAPNNDWLANRNDNSAWSRLTAPAGGLPTMDRDQQLAMRKQFQELLDPSRPAAPAKTFFTTTPASISDKSPWDSISSKPVMNPIGSAVTPLTTGIGVPTAIPTIPALGAPLPTAIKVGENPGAPQPAPWITPGPQPGVIPQRKF